MAGIFLSCRCSIPLRKSTDAAPFTGGFQWFPAVVSVTTFVALVWFKRGVLEVIGACAGSRALLHLRYRMIDGLRARIKG